MCRLEGNCLVYFCVSVASLSSILLGYDIGIMSGAIVYMEKDLGLTKWDDEIIIASFTFFSIIGAFIGGQFAASYGRKKTIALSSILFLFGSIIMVITKIFAFILFGRILLGIAGGLGLLVAPLYTAELSPPKIRGKLLTLAEICINIGVVLGFLIAWLFYFTHDDEAWRIMIALGCIPSIILFFGMLFVPESPRWLIEHHYIDKARDVLSKILNDTNNDEVEKQIKEIQKAIQMEEKESSSGWKEILLPCIYSPPLVLRKALIIGCGVAGFQQITGIDAITYYTPLIFRDLGLNDELILLCTLNVGITKLFFIFVAQYFIDKVGRRPLLLLSSTLITISLFGLTISFIIGHPPIFSILLQCLYVASFSIGWGPICWVMVSEIYPLQIRSRGMALSTSVNRIIAGFVALFFLSIKDALTPLGTWIMFTFISIIALGFVYKYVPETKGKTLEQITTALIYGVKHLRISDLETEDHDEIFDLNVDTDSNLHNADNVEMT